jgi:hypothetical protein
MMKHFTMDNTEGYNQQQLDELNNLLEAELIASEPDCGYSDDGYQEEVKAASERVLKNYDPAGA